MSTLAHLICTLAVMLTPALEVEEVWRTRARCGVNCAYVFLRLHGVDADYDNAVAAIPVLESGSTLEALRSYVSGNGVSAAAIRASPAELKKLDLPVIVHIESEDPALGFDGNRGHYVVLVRISDTVTFVDGTTGAIKDMNTDRFIRSWSGYLIVREKHFSRNQLILLFLGTGAISFLLAQFVSIRLRRRPQAVPEAHYRG